MIGLKMSLSSVLRMTPSWPFVRKYNLGSLLGAQISIYTTLASQTLSWKLSREKVIMLLTVNPIKTQSI